MGSEDMGIIAGIIMTPKETKKVMTSQEIVESLVETVAMSTEKHRKSWQG